jgi:trimeric autotransporter adhesin
LKDHFALGSAKIISKLLNCEVVVPTSCGLSRSLQSFLLFFVLLSLGHAQNDPSSRITGPIDGRVRVTLKGNVHPLAQPRFDLGAVADSFPASRMLLLLRRSAEREAALQQFLQQAHRTGGPSYHAWLTPRQFGALYGPRDSDISALSGWLEQQGFSVARVTMGKTGIEFSGTAGQVRQTFHTEIHAYLVNGETHYANNLDPQIPAALAAVVAGITPLNDFQPESYVKVLGKATYDRETHRLVPQWTFPDGNDALDFAPGDFALQYDLGPVYSAGVTGTGVTIGLIGASNVDPTAVATYRSFFGLPASPLNVVIDGLDPGENGAATESYLDVEQAGAVAPGATINLYTSAGTTLQSGLNLAAQRAVDDDVATILSTSYGVCEAYLGSAGNQFWNSLWEQAAAQGQTSFVSAGDGGPAGCDNFNNAEAAQYGVAMNGFSSTPWNVSVGGTDFYYSSYNGTASAQQTQLETYWDTVPTIYPTTSLLQSVPEQPWNQSFGLNLANGGVYNGNSPNIVAGSGGPSNCATGTDAPDGTYSSCTAGYAKPSWQSGAGVPSDGVRDLPDVSLFAAAGENDSFYPICEPGECVVSDGDLTIGIVGGTSASSPAMAGIMALIAQKYGRQGQANYVLYPLAAQHASAFHDITTGSNVVPCQAGTPNCTLSSADDNTKGFYVLGFDAGTGYDLASGLGSVDANQLFTSWNSLTFKSTTTNLNLSQTSFTHGTPITVSVGVSGSGGTPSGSVALVTAASPQNDAGPNAFTLQNGAASASVNTLPGGQYKVSARYSGDNLFASSNSASIAVNVTPETSSLSLFGSYNIASSNTSGALASGGTYPYGTAIAIEALAVGANAPQGSTDGIATGTVVFTDVASTGTINSGPLNVGSSNTAVWVPTAFAAGTHSVAASYSGDASFNASSSPAPLNFTITKAVPVAQLSGPSAAGRGQPVSFQLALAIDSSAPPPSGTATFYSGASALGTAAVVPSQVFYPFVASAATLNVAGLPAGTATISASYSGDSNYTSASSNSIPITVTQPAMVTGNANPASLLPTQDFTATASVAGITGQPAPTGYISFDAEGPGAGWTGTLPLVNGSFSFIFSGNTWSPGVVSVSLAYSGDAIYGPSSVIVPVTMLNPFTMTASTPVVIAAAGATTGNTSTLTITPANGFTGPVYFSCTMEYYPPGAQHLPSCSVPSPLTVTGTSPVTTAMTIASRPNTATSSADSLNRSGWIALQAAPFVAALVLMGFPRRRGRRRLSTFLFSALLILLMLGLTSCGGGGSSMGGQTVNGTTPGKYIFMVEGSYTSTIGSTLPQVTMVTVTIQ